MGIFAIVLVVCAALLIVGAEWPRVAQKLGGDARSARLRKRRKQKLRVVHGETDDFAASVQRDLENLPVIEERDGKSRR